jgi:phage gp29-like protein
MNLFAAAAAASKAFKESLTGPKDWRGYGVSVVEGVYNRARYYENPEDITAADLRRMWRRDDVARNAVSMRVLAALSTGWEIEPASEEEPDKQAAEFQREADRRLPLGYYGLLRAAQTTALVYGHSAHEPRWGDPLEDGDFRGMRCFRDIIERRAPTCYYHLDERGDLFKVTQDPMTGTVPVEWEPHELILHRIDQMDGQPYGNSPARTAYRWYFIKDDAISHWARYLERYGFPIPIAEYPYRQPTGPDDIKTSADNKANRELMISAIRELRQNSGMAVPSGWKLNLSNAAHAENADLYKSLIDACDQGIRSAFLIPRLVGDTSDSGGGAYALGKEHNDQFIWVLNSDRQDLERLMDRQVIAPQHKWNFAPTVGMPRFKFNPFSEEDMLAIVERLKFLKESGGKVSVQQAHEMLRVPMAEEDEELLKGGGGGSIVPGIGTPSLPGQAPGQQQWPNRPNPDEEEEQMDEEDKKMSATTRRPPTELERRINFEATNAEEDADAAFSGENLTVILESMAQTVEAQSGKGNGGLRGR